MKLAFGLFKYFPYGGLQRDFLNIAREALRRCHSVDVYTSHWEGEKNANINLHLIPINGLQNHTQNHNFANKFQKVIAKTKYDCVIGFNKMPGLDVYYAADTCFVAKKQNLWQRLTPRYHTLSKLEKSVFGIDAKTKILFISELQQAEFIRYYKTPNERFYFLPPGIARDRIRKINAAEIRQQLRQEWNIPSEHFLLLMIGSGFKTKGLDRILTGIAALPSVLQAKTHLFVIGQDNAEPYLKMSKRLKIEDKIKFLGGRPDIPEFLLAADLLVHPAYNENTGTVLLESLAAGLPVLTTDVCGYAHYILAAKAGMVLPSPFQQAQFNQTLSEMLLSPKKILWQQNALTFCKDADIYDMPVHAVNFIEALR